MHISSLSATICALCSLCLIACDHTHPNDIETPPVVTTDPTSGGGNTSTPTETTTPTETDDAILPNLDPPTEFSSWCSPQPIAYDTTIIPTLPKKVQVDGFCDAQAPRTPFETSQPRYFHLDPATRTIEMNSESFDGQFSTHTFDERGQIRHIFVRGGAGFYGQSQGLSWYDFNSAGEIVYKVAQSTPLEGTPEHEQSVLVKTQEWEGDRLLHRIETLGEEGPVVRHFSWSWDRDDRLRRAQLQDNTNPRDPRHFEVVWAYTEEGHPTEVERFIDGVRVEHETWTFTSQGQLTSRTYDSQSAEALAAEHGRAAYMWTFPERLEDMQRPTHNDTYSNPWTTSLPSNRGACATLPRGPGHGYPDAERQYHLGTPADRRPTRMGVAYGTNGFSWESSTRAWFGHLGVASDEALGLYRHNDRTQVAVHYDTQGRMIRVEGTLQHAGQTTGIIRTRTYLNGQMTQDQLTTTESAERTEHSLRFVYTKRGLLSKRILSVAGTDVQLQTWTHDTRGHLVSHTVLPNLAPWGDAVVSNTARPLFGQAAPVSRYASWFWRYEGDLLVERGQHEDPRIHQSIAYDGQGRRISTNGIFQSDDYHDKQAWKFDAEGRIVERCTENNGTRNCTQTGWDSAGRIAWRSAVYDNAEPVSLEHNLYVCP